MEASLLDSDVQELLGTEEVAGDELTSSPQLQWAAQAEFSSVVRLFELNCCAIPLAAVGGKAFLQCLHDQLLDWTWGRRGATSTCDRQELHILQILALWFLRTATTYSVVGPHCCMGREMQRSQGKLCAVFSDSAEKG